MADREQYGLRGPVRSCIEETTHPGTPAADGIHRAEIKFWAKTEYDVAGHLVTRRVHNANGSEWEMRYRYDAQGRPLTTITIDQGEAITETIYSYDDQGRPLKVSNSRNPENPVTFRYDQRGRKTKVQTSRPEDYRPNVAHAGPPFNMADRAPNLPGGGSATTLYDDQDRPIEVQVRDSQGEVVSRATRAYDPQGRVAEEQLILDRAETIIPAESRARILKESGISLTDLREQLKKVMGGRAGPCSEAYSYDEHGRIKLTVRHVFNEEAIIETTYNEHGDKSAQITRRNRIGNETHDAPIAPPYEEVRYSYEYDDQGNWLHETVSYCLSPDGPFQSSSERRRTLTYEQNLH